MFAKPRIKKSTLGPAPSKKRKAVHSIEEINFDNKARSSYLTGFHKRKVERVKQAQEIAAEKARQEKIEFRKQVQTPTGSSSKANVPVCADIKVMVDQR